jgi:hypothetical protein|eukprot:COSAG01_NODE_14859_length_1402_cov_1.718342_3_plen_160_part_00
MSTAPRRRRSVMETPRLNNGHTLSITEPAPVDDDVCYESDVSGATEPEMMPPPSFAHNKRGHGTQKQGKTRKDAGTANGRRMRFADEVSAADAVPEPSGRITRSKRRYVSGACLCLCVCVCEEIMLSSRCCSFAGCVLLADYHVMAARWSGSRWSMKPW